MHDEQTTRPLARRPHDVRDVTARADRPVGRDDRPHADSLARPRLRRLRMMRRPALVCMRERNPCLRLRRRLFGWYVRFTTALRLWEGAHGTAGKRGAGRVRSRMSRTAQGAPQRRPVRAGRRRVPARTFRRQPPAAPPDTGRRTADVDRRLRVRITAVYGPQPSTGIGPASSQPREVTGHQLPSVLPHRGRPTNTRSLVISTGVDHVVDESICGQYRWSDHPAGSPGPGAVQVPLRPER